MVKFHNRVIGVIVILLMLAASPLTVTYSFADNEENQIQEFKKYSKSVKQAILTEKIVDGKLEVHRFVLPDNATKGDMNRILSFEESSRWAYVNYKAYHPGIILFDGKAFKVGDNLWKISVDKIMKIDRMELDGKSNGSDVEIHGTASNNDLSYRVIFSGKVIESFEENIFAIVFMNSDLKNNETGHNIKFLHVGQMNIILENSIGNNQEFKK